MVFSTKDVAVVAGLGILAFLIIRGGRDLAGALGNINLPSIGDITLPEITLPSLPSLPNVFGDGGSPVRSNDPPFGGEPIEAPTPAVQPAGSVARITQDEQGNVTTIFSGGSEILTPEGPPLPPERPLNLLQFASNEAPRTIEDFRNQQDPNFIPLPPVGETLNDITQRLGITASQAADLRFRGEENDFDFGSNTGSGIGSIFTRPDINTEFGVGNVSDSQFAGLTPDEIVQRLLGGNINNF